MLGWLKGPFANWSCNEVDMYEPLYLRAGLEEVRQQELIIIYKCLSYFLSRFLT